jgi:putative acetyltransferase
MATVYLPNSETYLAMEKDTIIGFIAMSDNYLAAIFVQINNQESGIGKTLLNYIKERRETIQLKVYKKNSNTVAFSKNRISNYYLRILRKKLKRLNY